MSFKINTDKFGFAREPQPDRVSRDYAAELVRKLIADEKDARKSNDDVLGGYISKEAEIRGAEDERLQGLIGDINTVLNSHSGSIVGLWEQVQAEVQARGNKDDALQALINALEAELDSEKEARETEDNIFHQAIYAEVQAREAKDTELQTAINKEISDRKLADSNLYSAVDSWIDNEKSERTAADAALDDKINEEAQARAVADTELQESINNLINNKVGINTVNTLHLDDCTDTSVMYKVVEATTGGENTDVVEGFMFVSDDTAYFDGLVLPVGSIRQTLIAVDGIRFRIWHANDDTWTAWQTHATFQDLTDKISDVTSYVDQKFVEFENYTLEDFALNVMSLINEEASAREAADTELQTNIDKKQDKVTISEYPEDNSELIYDLSVMHNNELRTKSTLASGITFLIPNNVYPDDYVTSLSFSTGGTAPQISYSATGILNWVGTDCSIVDEKSIFAPKANTRYDIVIYFNGMQFVGLVNGFVPATINNSGQTEETTS